MSLSKAKHQHTDRMIKEKIEILGKLDCGVKAVDLCRQFNLSQSTLSTWKKQRCKLNKMVDAGKVLHTKHNCESFLPQVERALHLWFCENEIQTTCSTNEPIIACSEGYIVSISFDTFDMYNITDCILI